MFWDNVEISVRAGRGGDGLVSFRTARGESKGGPDGGDGGRGGSVILLADRNLNTLADYARQRSFVAASGQPGGKQRRAGKSAEDLILKVPVGTLAYEADRVLADLAIDGELAVIARGGRGGFGNAHFTSSTRQTPRHAELGEPGEQRELRLELKLVADVGLVGVPSVGKSTFLSRVTAAKPKIADYPFTTTVPQLGIAKVDDQTLVLADIPGLIEGAHAGKGLGDAFLRHIERTKVIVHLLDITGSNPAEEYRTIRRELESFNPRLAAKPEIVALNKADAIEAELAKLICEDVTGALGQPVHLVSAVSGQGVTELLREAAQLTTTYQPDEITEALPTFTLADLAPEAISIEPEDHAYRIRGTRIERLALQTDWNNEGAVRRFWWVFDRLGGTKQLEKLGAPDEPEIVVGEQRIRWQPA